MKNCSRFAKINLLIFKQISSIPAGGDENQQDCTLLLYQPANSMITPVMVVRHGINWLGLQSAFQLLSFSFVDFAFPIAHF